MASLKMVVDAIGTGSCEVAGLGKVALRMVPMAVTEAIGQAFPPPAPPLKKAVGGSLAPMEPDYHDAAYGQLNQIRSNRIVAATVAWALASSKPDDANNIVALTLEAGPPPRGGTELQQWVEKAADEVMQMSMPIIQRLSRAVMNIGESAEQDAVKN